MNEPVLPRLPVDAEPGALFSPVAHLRRSLLADLTDRLLWRWRLRGLLALDGAPTPGT
ncbi:MAG: hypothetical protein R3F60_25525 [bacterium]